MTDKAALCKALLLGKTLNIRNGFTFLGISNVPREIGRSVERAFGVKVQRTERTGVSRYGRRQEWVDYKLKIGGNEQGVSKMIEYVIKQEGETKTAEQVNERKKIESILLYVKEYL